MKSGDPTTKCVTPRWVTKSVVTPQDKTVKFPLCTGLLDKNWFPLRISESPDLNSREDLDSESRKLDKSVSPREKK